MEFISSHLVFSAPSGTGKTTIVNKLVQIYEQFAISISATTRQKRAYEEDGREYFFLKPDEFKEAIDLGKFIEYEDVHNEYYGTLKNTVDKLINMNKVVLFDIDVNGAKSIQKNYPGAVLFFIKPPSKEELVKRLQGRKSETEEKIIHRLKRLEFEYKEAKHFDYVIINDNLDDAIEQIENIIIKK